jgi:predicted CXXCH cytochrome family protein
LSFFFDGVPDPGTTLVSDPNHPDVGLVPGEVPSPSVTHRDWFSHTPYRNNRCGSCHSNVTGQLVRAPAEGLCMLCHAELVSSPRYVHGPAAVNECTFCHHYHASGYPALLLDEPDALCARCHDADTLTPDAHPAGPDQQTCVECHDPHGGANRFFVKRTER